ncbi:MAG TPA: hypothetical protein VF767_04170 [Bryobacteraceae bacterium]
MRKSKILIAGLEETLGAELSQILTGLQCSVVSQPYVSAAACLEVVDRIAAEAVFCTAEGNAPEELLKLLRLNRRQIPVMVVSRLPELDKWLDALDAGATDYCAPPFEPRLMRSLLENALQYPRPLSMAC